MWTYKRSYQSQVMYLFFVKSSGNTICITNPCIQTITKIVKTVPIMIFFNSRPEEASCFGSPKKLDQKGKRRPIVLALPKLFCQKIGPKGKRTPVKGQLSTNNLIFHVWSSSHSIGLFSQPFLWEQLTFFNKIRSVINDDTKKQIYNISKHQR